jgi:hypothetical protein
MVASERDASQSLVLASGLPWQWIAKENGFSVRHLPTPYGTLDMSLLSNEMHTLIIEIGGSLTIPAGGLQLCPPLPAGMSIGSIMIEQGALRVHPEKADTIEIQQLPLRAQVVLRGNAVT